MAKRVPMPAPAGREKVSKRQVVREASRIMDDLRKSRSENQKLFQMVFGLAVRLYILDPDDETFHNDSFKPTFLNNIKDAAEKIKDQENLKKGQGASQ